MKLRLYISKLSKADTRLFCAPGVRCSLDDELLGRALAAETGLSNRRLHIGWRLEKPDILEARLNVALSADGGRVQAPLESECQESCQMFVCFAIGKTAQWFNQPKQGIASRTSPMTQKTDRVFEVDPEYGNAALERPAAAHRPGPQYHHPGALLCPPGHPAQDWIAAACDVPSAGQHDNQSLQRQKT
jgi:hypothetical protein